VCCYFRRQGHADDVWKPLCLQRWPWLADRSGEEGWRRLFDKGTAYERLVEGDFFKQGMPHHFLIKVLSLFMLAWRHPTPVLALCGSSCRRSNHPLTHPLLLPV
jgi:hypothetical protein